MPSSFKRPLNTTVQKFALLIQIQESHATLFLTRGQNILRLAWISSHTLHENTGTMTQNTDGPLLLPASHSVSNKQTLGAKCS